MHAYTHTYTNAYILYNKCNKNYQPDSTHDSENSYTADGRLNSMLRQQLDIFIYVEHACGLCFGYKEGHTHHTRSSGLFTIALATVALNGKSKCVTVKYTMNYVQ